MASAQYPMTTIQTIQPAPPPVALQPPQPTMLAQSPQPTPPVQPPQPPVPVQPAQTPVPVQSPPPSIAVQPPQPPVPVQPAQPQMLVQPTQLPVPVQQPQPSVPPASTTVVITSQPTPTAPLTPLKDWSWGLLDVPDCELFALSWFCPCLVFGSTAQAIGHSYVLCCVAYVLTLLNFYILPLHFLLGCFLRERVRRHYRIQGNVLLDLLAYVFCCPCTLNQEALQADMEQRAQAAVTGAQQGLSIRLGSRVINLQANRVAQPAQPAQVPLLAPTQPPAVQYPAPSVQPVQLPSIQPSTAPPYPTGPEPALGFVVTVPTQA